MGTAETVARLRFSDVDPYLRGRMSTQKSYIAPFALGEPNHRIGVQYVDGNRRDRLRDARIARRTDDVGDGGFLGELPGQGVLARAGA